MMLHYSISTKSNNWLLVVGLAVPFCRTEGGAWEPDWESQMHRSRGRHWCREREPLGWLALHQFSTRSEVTGNGLGFLRWVSWQSLGAQGKDKVFWGRQEPHSPVHQRDQGLGWSWEHPDQSADIQVVPHKVEIQISFVFDYIAGWGPATQ